jgi:heterodisulfide reductase subunit C
LGKSEQELRAAFLAEVETIPGGEKLRKCIQCGTCTATCPVSYTMDLMPRAVIAHFRAGDIETILKSRTIWVCASCYSCTTRCPQGIKITDLLYALKRIAMEKGMFPEKFPVYALSESFVHNIDKYGRNFEMGMIQSYLMKTWTHNLRWMLSMTPKGLQMIRKGRLPLRPNSISAKGQKELAAIIKKAEQMETPQESVERPKITDTVGYKAIGS